MKVAVTAASGQLGSAIINHIFKYIRKDNVVGLARAHDKASHLGIEIRKADYNNKTDFDQALSDIDVVVIISSNDDPEKRRNQHLNIINAARESGVGKIIYTSIAGKPGSSCFDAIIRTNRQTEKDIMKSGMDWCIGRNGLYIELDLEYIDNYVKEGKILNCAGDGKCAYTTRDELAVAYTNMVISNENNGKIYNLVGEAITQQELANSINKYYGTQLIYEYIYEEDYKKDRIAAYGDFFGNVIAGIYINIKNGTFDVQSDYEMVTNRKHKSLDDMIMEFKNLR